MAQPGVPKKAPIPPPIRDILRPMAYSYSIQRFTAEAIAAALSKYVQENLGVQGFTISAQAVRGYIKHERKRHLQMYTKEELDALKFESKQINYQIIEDGFKRLAQLGPNQQNVPGIQANILAANRDNARLDGLLGEHTVQQIDAQVEFTIQIDRRDDSDIPREQKVIEGEVVR